jgi:phosphoenolpyruvate carboxylase
VYTVQQNVNLVEVFHAIEKSGSSLPDMKDNAVVKKYFEKVYPDMDFERVYNSDLKKMIKWYEVLKKNNIEIKISEPEEEVEPVIEEAEQTETPKKETAKSKTDKEKKSPAKKTKEKSSAKDKPAKKAAKKKGE